jgi:Flp pilus assembly protein TadG
MQQETRRFVPELCVQLRSLHVPMLMVGYALPCQRTIRTRRFCLAQFIRGHNLRPIHPLSQCGSNDMKFLFKNIRGATAVEFALVALPVLTFMFGITQTAFLVWADNLLHISVDAAARCGAVNSTTPPCAGTDMVTSANGFFAPLSGATFTSNLVCSADGGSGLVGTYRVGILAVNLTLSASSCYPTVLP